MRADGARAWGQQCGTSCASRVGVGAGRAVLILLGVPEWCCETLAWYSGAGPAYEAAAREVRGNVVLQEMARVKPCRKVCSTATGLS